MFYVNPNGLLGRTMSRRENADGVIWSLVLLLVVIALGLLVGAAKLVYTLLAVAMAGCGVVLVFLGELEERTIEIPCELGVAKLVVHHTGAASLSKAMEEKLAETANTATQELVASHRQTVAAAGPAS